MPSPPRAIAKLEKPPIVEAICGLWFSPIHGLDPLTLGPYWLSRRNEFPKHSLQPPISPPGLRLNLGYSTPRTWFVSADDAFVIQFQPDRLYLNWRARGGTYPSFSAPDGLRDRVLREWEQFSAFCARELGHQPEVTAVEVTKIDQFALGDRHDTAALFPAAGGWLALADSEEPHMALQFEDVHDGRTTRVVIATAVVEGVAGVLPVLRMETNVTWPADDSGDLSAALDGANARANDVFSKLVPEDERRRRFGVKA